MASISQIFKKILDRIPSFCFSSRNEEKIPSYKGEIFWTLRDQDGNILDSAHIKNVVTQDASILLARLMKSSTVTAHQSEPNFGVLALAVGTGDVGWNANNPPSANKNQRSLYNEIARKKIASSSFIDADGNISAVPTNVVDFTTIFSESEAVGGLTEMGLIGGDASTNMAIQNPALPANGTYSPSLNLTGLDTLVNYVTFPVINKSPTSTLSWTWRLTFLRLPKPSVNPSRDSHFGISRVSLSVV